MFQTVIWFIAAGHTFFIGIALLIISIIFSMISKKVCHKLIIYFFSIISLVLIFMAVILLPRFYYFAWAILITGWLLFFASKNKVQNRYFNFLSIAVLCSTLFIFASAIPLVLKPDMPKERFDKLFIIGDSVSAGIGGKAEKTWPKIFINKYGANVIDLSVSGSTVTTAIRQARQITEPNQLVLLEIGGNDFLFSTPYPQFENSFKQILELVKKQNSTIVMMEIPMLPKHFRYGEIQRRLAKEYDTLIVPKRFFASVQRTKGAGRDFIHLSEKGHQLMAEKLWYILRPCLEN
ncbi:MAG: hypothetical protein A2Y10_13605 [Planctomycetes bacterium GWF2_41_51]|nr:MAG: hypothetical protein A2Y10_13605 [Planctomycetes bacterium GWF2_41_51]